MEQKRVVGAPDAPDPRFLFSENLNPGESTTELPQLPADAKHLQAGADIACHRVEIDQHDTFKLQVLAICDLALGFGEGGEKSMVRRYRAPRLAVLLSRSARPACSFGSLHTQRFYLCAEPAVRCSAAPRGRRRKGWASAVPY